MAEELERLHRAYIAYCSASYSKSVLTKETLDNYTNELLAAVKAHRES